jgi:hypothetical protein
MTASWANITPALFPRYNSSLGLTETNRGRRFQEMCYCGGPRQSSYIRNKKYSTSHSPNSSVSDVLNFQKPIHSVHNRLFKVSRSKPNVSDRLSVIPTSYLTLLSPSGREAPHKRGEAFSYDINKLLPRVSAGYSQISLIRGDSCFISSDMSFSRVSDINT